MTSTNNRHPDPVLHKYISFAKSGLRIGAGVFLFVGFWRSSAALFILAEVLGIIEELV